MSLPIEFGEFSGRSNRPADTQLLSGFFELLPAHVDLSQPNAIARFQFAHSASGRNQALPEAGFGVRQVVHSQGKVPELAKAIEPAGSQGRHGLHRTLFYEAFLPGRRFLIERTCLRKPVLSFHDRANALERFDHSLFVHQAITCGQCLGEFVQALVELVQVHIGGSKTVGSVRRPGLQSVRCGQLFHSNQARYCVLEITLFEVSGSHGA